MAEQDVTDKGVANIPWSLLGVRLDELKSKLEPILAEERKRLIYLEITAYRQDNETDPPTTETFVAYGDIDVRVDTVVLTGDENEEEPGIIDLAIEEMLDVLHDDLSHITVNYLLSPGIRVYAQTQTAFLALSGPCLYSSNFRWVGGVLVKTCYQKCRDQAKPVVIKCRF